MYKQVFCCYRVWRLLLLSLLLRVRVLVRFCQSNETKTSCTTAEFPWNVRSRRVCPIYVINLCRCWLEKANNRRLGVPLSAAVVVMGFVPKFSCRRSFPFTVSSHVLCVKPHEDRPLGFSFFRYLFEICRVDEHTTPNNNDDVKDYGLQSYRI